MLQTALLHLTVITNLQKQASAYKQDSVFHTEAVSWWYQYEALDHCNVTNNLHMAHNMKYVP